MMEKSKIEEDKEKAMKKLMIMSAMIFSLSFLPVASHALGISRQPQRI